MLFILKIEYFECLTPKSVKSDRRGKLLITKFKRSRITPSHNHATLLLHNTYNPGQNVLGHLRKLGKKTHFAKLTHILPLKKALGCCYKGLFLLSPSPPSSVDCVELKLECITSTLHRGGRGEERCLNLTSYCVSVPTVLTRVVVAKISFRETEKMPNSQK